MLTHDGMAPGTYVYTGNASAEARRQIVMAYLRAGAMMTPMVQQLLNDWQPVMYIGWSLPSDRYDTGTVRMIPFTGKAAHLRLERVFGTKECPPQELLTPEIQELLND